MSTGSFESFAARIADIGPLYPFVGSEVVLVIVAVGCWIAWHVYELRMEQRDYDKQLKALDDEPPA